MAGRRLVVAGNWKMNLDRSGCRALAAGIRERFGDEEAVRVAVFPACPYLTEVASVLKGSRIGLGAQDVAVQDEGAFTGEVSGKMLRDVGCQLVLIGHSERRHVIGEGDDRVGAKLGAALRVGLWPVLCVGETLDEREAGETNAVLERQLGSALAGRTASELRNLIVAYEPVWAIGTGKTARPDQASEAHGFIRQQIARLVSPEFAGELTIQYGGSVKGANAAELLGAADIDGALVGGASLSIEAFAPIVESAVEIGSGQEASDLR